MKIHTSTGQLNHVNITEPLHSNLGTSTRLASPKRMNLLFTLGLFTVMLFILVPIANAEDKQDIEDTTIDTNDPNDKASKDNPCDACKLVVTSFESGMEKTSRGKYEGGDTSWEEKNLRSYADSEVRLIEIQEDLCNELTELKNKTTCLSMAENAESHIEDWWFDQRNKNVRLHDFLCISRLKHCCSVGFFGPTCQKCSSECNNHGHCNGSGTRQGTGACICTQGYGGRECDQCSSGYFEVAINDQELTCLKCDYSCLTCNGPGAGNCTECRSGFRRDQATGFCVDINECELVFDNNVEASRVCRGNTYCLNTNGHYKCVDCHEACSGCYGPEAANCYSCASGYQMDPNDVCLSDDEIDILTRILGYSWSNWSPAKFFHYSSHHLIPRLLGMASLNGLLAWWVGADYRTTLWISIVISLFISYVTDFYFKLRETNIIEVNSV